MVDFLLIDDDHIFNFLNAETIRLTNPDYRYKAFTSPFEALDHLKKSIHAKDKLPDIILLDIRMPEMTGFDFLDELMKEDTTPFHKTSVYILSSSLDQRDMKKAEQNPLVSGFRSKPLTEEMVADMVRNLPSDDN